MVTPLVSDSGKCRGFRVTIVFSAVASATATKGRSSGSGSFTVVAMP